MKKIWLAGGCFWGVEAYFMQLKGVITTRVGYGQGNTTDPTYKQVCSGKTGYTEVCELTYDEVSLSLEKVLEHFFRIINPVTLNRQGPDEGPQYRSGVYYSDAGDREVIIDFIKDKQVSYKEPIVVEVEPVRNFYLAEDYHQEYLQKTPGGYCHVNLMLARPEEKK
ncbi:peptide-methionine (S)-S-oxide reductase MsrA [Pelosinus sp. IPA-1]|uniref:peptide-methionine (S)-S-oxide reductase MsrA n=1 Tax=Pelosinus sp. IPA-1 TaxID=3029569 RepID=UPI00243620A1|nr:peptide-methionine (S)-S-oxide reductase MsrA [Pelosinus sp. IPA-1]GMA99035.1 peptide methionine sulfoxide reductase MsrA [Pelosinus sp. IPA-1]